MAKNDKPLDPKIKSAVSLLQEKLKYAGYDFENKSIIIKNGELTIK